MKTKNKYRPAVVAKTANAWLRLFYFDSKIRKLFSDLINNKKFKLRPADQLENLPNFLPIVFQNLLVGSVNVYK